MTQLPKNTLLLLIDLQNAIDDPSWGKPNNPLAEQNILDLLTAWRTRLMPILHVKHMSTDPASTYRPNQAGNDFKAITAPLPTEAVMEKQTNSAFIGTDLEARLAADGIQDLVIVGVITNNSVEATARMAGNLGYNTVAVADGMFMFGRRDFAGVWQTADTVHNLSLANMDGEYATVLTTEAILRMI